MIVKHQNKDDRVIDNFSGVIIGWHRYEDRRNVKFSQTQLLNPVLPLKIYNNNTKKQTHYIILTDNNQMCYVEEGMNIIKHMFILNYIIFLFHKLIFLYTA